MTKDEALHKALKVLNCLNNDRVYETAWVKGAINACEEALEQPKNTQPLDEVIEEFMKDPAMKQAMDKAREKLSPLFSHPKEWQGLSDVELSLLAEEYTGADGLDVVDYGYAIEAKLKEKNG